MRIPNRNSCGMAIWQALYKAGELDMPGLFAALKGRFATSGVMAALEATMDQGCVARKGDMLSLSLTARRYMEESTPQPKLDPRPLVPSRTAPPFKPLSYKPGSLGLREGSNDHKGWKTRY